MRSTWLFCAQSPSDRKQIETVAERMFEKNGQCFMTAYYQETERPYAYIFVDNKRDTAANEQVLSDIFGSCQVYPSINKSLKPEGEVESILPKDLMVPQKYAEAKSSSRKPKPFDLDWCGMTWPTLQNYLH